MATFSTRFLGCKVSFADAQSIRERLLADGHVEVDDARRDPGRQHVLRDPRGGLEVPPGASRAARSARTVYVTGCASNLEDAFAGAPDNVVVTRRTGGRSRCLRRGRCRGDRLRRRPAPPRPRAGVRPDPGRLLVLVRLLRDPARPGRDAQPDGGRGADRGSPARAPGPSRGRPHRRQPRLLPRPGGGLHARAARPRGRRDARARAPAAVVDRGEPRDGRPRRRADRDADRLASHLHVPLQSGDDGVLAGDGAPLHGGAVRAAPRAAPRAEPHDRRDRRLPRRGRCGVRADVRARRAPGDEPRPRVPVLAAAGDADRRRGHRSARR